MEATIDRAEILFDAVLPLYVGLHTWAEQAKLDGLVQAALSGESAVMLLRTALDNPPNSSRIALVRVLALGLVAQAQGLLDGYLALGDLHGAPAPIDTVPARAFLLTIRQHLRAFLDQEGMP